ncbi:MAG: glycosyltransferase family 87 protein [Bacteroidota bacterium]
MRRLFSHPIFKNQTFIAFIYILAAAIACLVKVSLDFKPHDAATYISKVNNFIIFKNSFYHLINHTTLYGPHPVEQYDLYKYSPTFALLFAPFALFPTYIGAVLWAVFNAFVLFWAIAKLPIDAGKKTFIYWFALIELLTSIQNSQVNPLIAALFLFTFIAFERKQLLLAALLVILSAYIKVYGILGAALFVLYPDKIKFMLYCIGWTILLFLLPMLVISYDELLNQYEGWQDTIANDHQTRAVDVSIMRFVMAVSGMEFSNKMRLLIQIVGVVIFCLKYTRTRLFALMEFRLLVLASVMIWSIVFNHLAESATYIIAIVGIALWYTTEQKHPLTIALLIACFILSSLSPTDIFPRSIRELYIVPYALKALPCFLVWAYIEYRLLTGGVSAYHKTPHAD